MKAGNTHAERSGKFAKRELLLYLQTGIGSGASHLTSLVQKTITRFCRGSVIHLVVYCGGGRTGEQNQKRCPPHLQVNRTELPAPAASNRTLAPGAVDSRKPDVILVQSRQLPTGMEMSPDTPRVEPSGMASSAGPQRSGDPQLQGPQEPAASQAQQSAPPQSFDQRVVPSNVRCTCRASCCYFATLTFGQLLRLAFLSDPRCWFPPATH